MTAPIIGQERTGILDVEISELEYLVDEDIIRVEFSNVPILGVLDNDLMMAGVVNFEDIAEAMVGGAFNIWCHPEVYSSSLLNSIPIKTNSGQQVALANRDVWATTCMNTVNGISLLVRNGFNPAILAGLMPLCWQIKIRMASSLDNLVDFFNKKTEQKNQIWGPNAAMFVGMIRECKKTTLENPKQLAMEL